MARWSLSSQITLSIFRFHYDYYQPEAYVPTHGYILFSERCVCKRSYWTMSCPRPRYLLERKDAIIAAPAFRHLWFGWSVPIWKTCFTWAAAKSWINAISWCRLAELQYSRNDVVEVAVPCSWWSIDIFQLNPDQDAVRIEMFDTSRLYQHFRPANWRSKSKETANGLRFIQNIYYVIIEKKSWSDREHQRWTTRSSPIPER